MSHYMEFLNKKIKEVKEYWTWSVVEKLLDLEEAEQRLLCFLWTYSKEYGRELTKEEFFEFYQEWKAEWSEEPAELPVWVYEMEGQVVLSPVVRSWLDGEVPKLPKGAEFYLTMQERAYDLDPVFADMQEIFKSFEMSADKAVICIEGETGSGRTFCMKQICARQDLTLLVLDADEFAGTERELNACMLCAKLYDAFVCVKLGKEVREKLLTQLSDCFRVFGLIKDEKRDLTESLDVMLYTRKLVRPARTLKTVIARELLGEWIEKLPSEVQLTQLTGRQLPMGAYIRYIKNVLGELKAGTFKPEHVQTASVSSSLNLLPATRTFAELKLPKAQYDQLYKISQMIATREEVLSGWGFGGKFTYGNGMSVLFYGAPGTGKTMAAQVLANELGMPLYRVDLSQLISKYIGETQKNIGRIFDEAEKCDCILLFDEADAIFSKRSDVSDAQDRYSNAETAYLLQRIEQYAGVSILATNLLQNFDEAFRRRISYMVHFPMPDANLRNELWGSIFPKETPVSSEVDALMLAQAFELSGASIKNAALHGALLARAENGEVRMCHILDGIRNEYGKQGKSFSSSQKELLDAYQ